MMIIASKNSVLLEESFYLRNHKVNILRVVQLLSGCLLFT